MVLVFPGSFDPVTKGHVDIALRGSQVAERLIVALLTNPGKRPMFSQEERLDFLTEVFRGYQNIEVLTFDGLLADFVLRHKAHAILRGVRSAGDLASEMNIAHANFALCGIETVFLTSRPEHHFITSSIVREVVSFSSENSLHINLLTDMLPALVYNSIAKLIPR